MKGDEVRKTTNLPVRTRASQSKRHREPQWSFLQMPTYNSHGPVETRTSLFEQHREPQWSLLPMTRYIGHGLAPQSVSFGILWKYKTTTATKGDRASISTIDHTSTPLSPRTRVFRKLDSVSPDTVCPLQGRGGGGLCRGMKQDGTVFTQTWSAQVYH